jgi:hypothetical protein
MSVKYGIMAAQMAEKCSGLGAPTSAPLKSLGIHAGTDQPMRQKALAFWWRNGHKV